MLLCEALYGIEVLASGARRGNQACLSVSVEPVPDIFDQTFPSRNCYTFSRECGHRGENDITILKKAYAKPMMLLIQR